VRQDCVSRTNNPDHDCIRQQHAIGIDENEAARKNVLLQLDPAQRGVIAGILEECRRGAIHDLLAHLEWLMTSDGFRMSWKGVDIYPIETLHLDFIGRAMGLFLATCIG
jgi:hypothetical protein